MLVVPCRSQFVRTLESTATADRCYWIGNGNNNNNNNRDGDDPGELPAAGCLRFVHRRDLDSAAAGKITVVTKTIYLQPLLYILYFYCISSSYYYYYCNVQLCPLQGMYNNNRNNNTVCILYTSLIYIYKYIYTYIPENSTKDGFLSTGTIILYYNRYYIIIK